MVWEWNEMISKIKLPSAGLRVDYYCPRRDLTGRYERPLERV